MTPDQIIEQLTQMLGPESRGPWLERVDAVEAICMSVDDARLLATSIRRLIAAVPESELL